MNTIPTPFAILTGILLCVSQGVSAQVPTTSETASSVALVAPANVGGSVTIGGTSYVVSAKKQLATGVEYYTMKPATTKVKGATFIRTNGFYEPTVFTQAQFAAFFSTGKLSSFGALKTSTSGGKTFYHTTKGAKIVSFLPSNIGSRVLIHEYPDAVPISNDGPIPQPTGSEANRRCWTDCEMDWAACDDQSGVVVIDDPASCPSGAGACECNMEACAWECNREVPRHKLPVNYVLKLDKSLLFR